MANIETKYDYGQSVTCHGIAGKVTAITIRGEQRTYEFSYVADGRPASWNAEECELKNVVKNKLGFKSG